MKHDRHLQYVTGLAEFDRLAEDETFLDFLYAHADLGVSSRHGAVSMTTADPALAALGAHWIRRLSSERAAFTLQFEAEQDVVELVRFWSCRLAVSHERIRLCPGMDGVERLEAREGANGNGVLGVRVFDPVLQIRLEAWVGRIRRGWGPSMIDELARLPSL